MSNTQTGQSGSILAGYLAPVFMHAPTLWVYPGRTFLATTGFHGFSTRFHLWGQLQQRHWSVSIIAALGPAMLTQPSEPD